MKTQIKILFKGRSGSIILAVMEIVVGILLLIDPLGFTGSIIVGAGVVAILSGVISIVRYFMTTPDQAAHGQYLFRGVVSIMAGAVAVGKSGWFISAFPLLTVIYAIAMLILSAFHVQKMADMLRLQAGRWYLPGISALLSATLAIIILCNPFGAVAAVWTFVAVSLIAEAVVELASVFLA